VQPASLPPAGLPGLDPAWSRLVDIVDADGVPRTFHILDSWAGHPADSQPVGTLLCVHGNPTWSYLWRRLVEAAPAGWRVVAPDHLGMGYSERIDTPRVLAQRVDDLGRLTDALGITGLDRTGQRRAGPVVTVAHDWGGIISLGWAAEHREQLRGVVLTNTAVHQPETSKGPVLIRLAHHPLLNRISCRWTPLFVRTTTSLTWPRLPRDVRNAFAAPYDSVARRLPISEFVADIPFATGHPSRPTLDRVADGITDLDVPALLLWGPRDPVFLEEHLRDLQDRLPQADLHRYEKASHLLPEDAPGYAAAVGTWVAALDMSPSDAVDGRHRTPIVDEPAAALPSVFAELSAHTDDDSAAVVEVGGRSISWADLASRVRNTAAGLSAAGVKPGDRVALLVPPSIELTVALYSVWQAGAVIVVVDKGLGVRGMGRALRSARIDHQIADTAGLLAAGPMRVPGTRISTREVSAALRRVARVSHTLPTLARAGRDLPCPAEWGITESGPEDEAAVVFTSGATGPAKGVLYRHQQIRAQLELIRASYRITGNDRIVAAFAPFALYGPALGVPSAVPATDVTQPGTLTAAALGDAAAAIDATVVFASPAALANVLATAADATPTQRAALGRVRLLMSAGAPVPAELLRRLAVLLPNADMHTPYGMTEGLPLTDISLPEIEAAGRGDGVCVGRPLPGVEVLVAPLDASAIPGIELTAEPGVTGEIWVRAAHLKARYDTLWVLEQAAAAHPGWHRTGDVGALDEQGRLWVQGRTVHVVSTAAGPVTPVGIEQRVQRRLGDQPGLAGGVSAAGGRPGVAVVGVGPVGTQQVVVVLSGAGGPLASVELTDTARAAAGRDVAAVLVMKALPVDIRHNSKIDRVAVARWADRQLSGR
jgi:acyl-CoA synthetase (AMP-forming)/AMP-acid ligase II/pimeloyl-ACP methyl ester carboxylesterase